MPSPDRRTARTLLLALLGLAVALRVTHLTWGLPSLIEEAMPLRRALAMIDPASGRIDWNPHFFNYPSLSIYLQLVTAQVVQWIGRACGHYGSAADFLLSFQIDPGPMLVAGRLVHTLADISTVWAVWRIGRRVSLPCAAVAAGLVAASPLLVRTQNTIIVDTLVAALAAWSIERALAWREWPRAGTLAAAAALAGLAASAKYPGAALLVPLFAVVASAGRDRVLPRLLAVTGVAALAFVLTSPFVLLDAHAALRDLAFERSHAAIGHLGAQGGGRWLANVRPLLSLGPAALLLLVLVPFAARERRVRRAVLACTLALVALATPALGLHIDAERYLAPVVPMAAVLAGIAAAAVAARVPVPQRAWALAALAAVILVPVLAGGVHEATGGTDDTQRLAHDWCVRHLPAGALVVEEGWSAPLVTRDAKARLRDTDLFRRARPSLRARFDALPAYAIVSVPHRVTGTVTAGTRTLQAIDLDGRYYELALYAAADYVITSDAVRGRYEADPKRFAAPCRFYAFLDARAERAATFRSSRAVSGPTVTVYRIGDAARAALHAAPLADGWWLPDAAPRAAATGAARELRDWRSVHAAYFRPFAGQLAVASLERGDVAQSGRIARALLAADPADSAAAAIAAWCARAAPRARADASALAGD